MKLKTKNQKTGSSVANIMSTTSAMLLLLLMVCTLVVSCDPSDDNPKPVIDLKAESITFSVVKTTSFVGVATIKGTIKNIGDAFVSGDNQQGIILYERALGTPSGQSGVVVAKKSFNSLDVGETLEVTYSRTWNVGSPAEGEFPPEYILVIGYDPDLYIDGNEHNDDINHENDRLTVSGNGINILF